MRDERRRSARPKRIGDTLDRALGPVTPMTPLAELQRIWPSVAGPEIAAVTSVSDERDGTVTIECESAVWAAELEMMGAQFREKLRPLMGEHTPEKLRFRA
ncbi:MAG: DUF721 domain-containing protein [Solirubrobacterales bacterium]|nr:DUF721 domain-containing protein [Solirubrobacterales bacterium]